jgi:hypothetical protein
MNMRKKNHLKEGKKEKMYRKVRTRRNYKIII